MSLTAARALQYLCSLILGYHTLELQQQLIFSAGSLRGFDKKRLNTMKSEFLDQKNLVGILATQAIWRVREHNLNLPFSGEISHTLKIWPLQRC